MNTRGWRWLLFQHHARDRTKTQDSQSLLGKELDIHIPVLGQLLQDGLDLSLQCAVVQDGPDLL